MADQGASAVIFRRKKDPNETEGWWEVVESSTSPDLHGKIEWEPSMEGGTEIDLLVRDLDIPDGEEVEVVCENQTILRAPVERGSARKIVKSSEGHSVPNLGGKAVELRHRGVVLARAVLEPD
ncbi:MAG: hypothetical protein KY439_10955 [Actinobacteria bacterium]|nr:hypothetical protein [Actinomycetota bacterium]